MNTLTPCIEWVSSMFDWGTLLGAMLFLLFFVAMWICFDKSNFWEVLMEGLGRFYLRFPRSFAGRLLWTLIMRADASRRFAVASQGADPLRLQSAILFLSQLPRKHVAVQRVMLRVEADPCSSSYVKELARTAKKENRRVLEAAGSTL